MTTPADLPGDDLTAQRPHKPADDAEEVYFEGSPALRAEAMRMLTHFLIAIAIIAGAIFFKLPLYATAAIVLIGLIIVLVPILVIKSTRYRISNYRIDYQRGFFTRRIDTLELWHVEDLSLYQTLLDRILGVGAITVISRDEVNPQLRLRGLPHPQPLFDNLKQRIIAVKRQSGVIKMDPG